MQSVKCSNDLVTSKDATIEGFSWQVNEKVEKAYSFAANAKYFVMKAKNIRSIADVRADAKLTEFVIAACMLSQKSLSHLSIDMQNDIIKRLIDFARLNDPEYVKSLEQRYFLTSGDSLGGSMRNIIGQSAQEKLTESVFARLECLGKRPVRSLNRSKTVAIKWQNRQIIFDKKPSFIGKSVDFIVVNGSSANNGYLESPADYVCCGELKGGIDPAGADEHWKTAKTALERIVTSFREKGVAKPKLFFLGAAIETAMSAEIFSLLQSGWLTGAANINYENQFSEIVDMIIA